MQHFFMLMLCQANGYANPSSEKGTMGHRVTQTPTVGNISASYVCSTVLLNVPCKKVTGAGNGQTMHLQSTIVD